MVEEIYRHMIANIRRLELKSLYLGNQQVWGQNSKKVDRVRDEPPRITSAKTEIWNLTLYKNMQELQETKKKKNQQTK